MKTLTVLSALFWVLSSSASPRSGDVAPDVRDRLDELVIAPLKENGKFWYLFTRTRVVRPAVELRLTTASPRKDSRGRAFVPFRVEHADETESPGRAIELTGCYYPRADVAYLFDDLTEAHVPVEQHPLITMQLPSATKEGTTVLCRP